MTDLDAVQVESKGCFCWPSPLVLLVGMEGKEHDATLASEQQPVKTQSSLAKFNLLLSLSARKRDGPWSHAVRRSFSLAGELGGAA